jgi:hypothetical protein
MSEKCAQPSWKIDYGLTHIRNVHGELICGVTHVSDARKIVAVPALLQTLDRLVLVLKRVLNDDDTDGAEAALIEAQTVIAQATKGNENE